MPGRRITDLHWWHVMTRVDVDSWYSWCIGLDCDHRLFDVIRLDSVEVGSCRLSSVFPIFFLPGRSNSGSKLWELIQLCEMNEAQLFHHSAWQTFDLDPVDPVNPCHSSAMAVVAGRCDCQALVQHGCREQKRSFFYMCHETIWNVYEIDLK